ncbi:hypothetical protein PTTG_28289 [Puccinia triticina 1-1 BBBD Race 1]|uniref:Retrotransposon gag domain-containing protein n=1 Tax=Puccinia triticina (isolate 1-1 / race 1 (BBBD)) TaxID=630390 RepID=A0A180GCP8_PUCT1|nr:hypothetical protein PTTG_28289 [Puccinia triticina 1-1 BBBD Race 1]
MLNSGLPPPSSSKADPSGGKGKRPATATAEAPEKPDSAKGWVKMILEIQHNAALQAQADCKEAGGRIDRLEKLFLATTTASQTTALPDTSKSNRIDRRWFRADGPKFSGPFREVEPFLNWVQSVQIYFKTRDITDENDKLDIVGGLLDETNLISLYKTEIDSYMGRPWADFKACLFEVALPTFWRDDLEEKIQHLSMLDNVEAMAGDKETFALYSTRARTLQSLFNFDKPTLSDLGLAKLMVYGMPQDLKAKVKEWQLLEAKEFLYSFFEQRCNTFYEALPRQPMSRFQPFTTSSPTTSNAGGSDIVPNCLCPGPFNGSHVEIPPSFITPPKPPNYTPPQAWSTSQPPKNPNSGPGRTSAPPAGLAALTRDKYPAILASAIAIYREIDVAAQGNELAGLSLDEIVAEECRPLSDSDFVNDVEENPIYYKNLGLAATATSDNQDADPTFDERCVDHLLGDPTETTLTKIAEIHSFDQPNPHALNHEHYPGRDLPTTVLSTGASEIKRTVGHRNLALEPHLSSSPSCPVKSLQDSYSQPQLDLRQLCRVPRSCLVASQQEASFRPVFVKRVMLTNTIKQRILALQKGKQDITDSTLGKGTGKKLKRMAVSELATLFNLNTRGEVLE